MRWSSLLSQRPPSTSASEGKGNPTTFPSDTDEKATSCEPPPPTPTPPLDPDERISFISPSPPSSINTKPESSPNCLTEEALLALTSQPLIHGGAWSSPRNPKSEKQANEKVYAGIGEARRQRSPSELAREKQWMSKRKKAVEDKRREAEEATMNQVRSRDRWTKPEREDGLDVANWCRGSWH
ncbi:hypothetical protein OCU04_002696 [Sclerotinia nivalis]|uniref:Uncharacterized protein n=1 Tax=Sclerotinia nivalis TaxID=352851 RepID=A0A9X0AUA9_9HELO|nr:hypothetical protein OCU04_002696 [Sclerotinia nivalis]